MDRGNWGVRDTCPITVGSGYRRSYEGWASGCLCLLWDRRQRPCMTRLEVRMP
jgi:hypothetical protein